MISVLSGFSALRCKYADEWTYLVLLFMKLPGNMREIVWVVYLLDTLFPDTFFLLLIPSYYTIDCGLQSSERMLTQGIIESRN